MKKKKLFKRILIFLLLLVIIIIALPFLLKDTLIKKYVEKLNNDYNIEITYDDVDISIFKHFPSARLTINDLKIITESPFTGDTLLFSKSIFLDINIKDAFKKNVEKIKIKKLTFDKTKLNLLINENGIANYTISKKDTSNVSTSENSDSENLKFELSNYNLKNADILFSDKKSNVYLNLQHINHTGNGDFTSSQTDLKTKTTVDTLTLKIGNVAYFNKVKIDLDAILGIDFKENKYTFKENKAQINDLKLSFNGFVKLNEDNVETNIYFNAPKANFKSILSLIPNAYSTNFNDVKATGIANVSGKINGKSSDNETPKYNIKIISNSASFKYPDLPKKVTNINFDGAIVSNTSKNNPFLTINKLKFTIDTDTFETHGKITNLTTNPTFDTTFIGTLNLENIAQAYPIKLENKLTGILKADFTTQADQNSIKNNDFNKIKTKGSASLQDFSYEGKDVANIIFVKNANVKFNTSTISLTDFNAKTGKSDIKATGTLENLYAFLFDKKDLKGKFNVVSDNFIVSDFLVDQSNNSTTTKGDGSKSSATTESLKIPDFLDVTTTMKAKNVVYDDLILKDVSGTMQLKDQKAILRKVKAKMMQGDVSFNGIVDTKSSPSTFDLDMNINDFDIKKSFTKMETFQKIIPIAKALSGKYDTKFKIKGNLNDDFSPDINTLNGTALSQLFVDDIDKNSIPLLQALTSKLKFLDIKKLNLKKLKTALTFENGRVGVSPFEIKYKDITMYISGNHGFDKTLQYGLKMDVPAKYLGNEAANLLSQLTNINKDTIRVPLTAVINGSILKPNVKPNFKQAIKALAVKVAKYQKEQLLNQVTEQANDIISDVIEDNEVIKDVIEDNGVINDILQGTGITKPKDSTSTNPNTGGIINDAANDILDGFFGKKKKKKDTVN